MGLGLTYESPRKSRHDDSEEVRSRTLRRLVNAHQPGVPHIAKKRKVSWGSRTLGGAERFATLASVVQTGKMQGLSLRELGARVLMGRLDPLGLGAGPPH